MNTRVFKHQGWSIVLTPEAFHPAQGKGTPAMVYGPNGQCSSFARVSHTGEILNGDRTELVPEDIMVWITIRSDDVRDFLDAMLLEA